MMFMEKSKGTIMKSFWISWYTALDDPESLPFDAWITGERVNPDFSTHSVSICAVIKAETEEDAYNEARKYYPDLEERFCSEQTDDFEPGDRFPKSTLETEDKSSNEEENK
jgi:hypothetical protein